MDFFGIVFEGMQQQQQALSIIYTNNTYREKKREMLFGTIEGKIPS